MSRIGRLYRLEKPPVLSKRIGRLYPLRITERFRSYGFKNQDKDKE